MKPMPRGIPEDLNLKIGSKRAVWWTTIKAKLEENILNGEESLIADKYMIKLAEKIIEEESAKFK